jgi:nitronate monooxygenase
MPSSADVDLRRLAVPIVQAPLAGGASTPELTAAVASAGGFGFLAAGYKTAEALATDVATLRRLSDAPFGVNLFAPPAPESTADAGELSAYAERLAGEAAHYGVQAGEPRHDDDGYEAKLELMERERPAVVSFTFGCPDVEVLERLHASGSDVWVTVTSPDEAEQAAAAGADALVVQGLEAGGHRGGFSDPPGAEELGLLALLALVRARLALPLVAAGGIADGAAVAAVLCAGAAAAQLGTALMLTPEAGTPAPQRAALSEPGQTALTRAFTGRSARGIVNRFMREHAEAPVAYPDVHHLTAPIRAAARAAGDAEAINLWAGQTHELARSAPAAEIITAIADDARVRVAAVAARLERDSAA